MGKYFGTDGFRGEANQTLTSMQAYRIGRFIGWYFGKRLHRSEKARIVIGKDTRLSSYMLEYSIAAGITASGADAYMLHVITTPGVSYVTRVDGFDLGVMITASHNPYNDNGIKLINQNGEKLDDATCDLIEQYIDGNLSTMGVTGEDLSLAVGREIGRIYDYVSGRNRYVGYLISLASNSYKRLKIGIDTANGAAWMIAPGVFSALGAHVECIGDEPSGENVNLGCGSTHIDALRRLVKDRGLDLGFAFDGDADRCIAVDSFGNVIDGDRIMYILASRFKKRNMLTGDSIAVTVMSNSGFIESLRRLGISASVTDVGDRYIYERMQSEGLALGGEQSGHIIIGKYATTGDGILTAIMLCEELCDAKMTLYELARGAIIYPQCTLSVRVRDKDAAMSDSLLCDTVQKIEAELSGRGRVLIRKSGTEPVIRVMVECEDELRCSLYAQRIQAAINEGERSENEN